MKVDQDKCIACKRCFAYCPFGRIQRFARHEKIKGRIYAEIDQEICTDCGMCLRANICPVSALFQPETTWPREVRARSQGPHTAEVHSPPESAWPREVRGILSNPMIEFLGSQTPGRGTEEMKTNDVKGSFLPGEVGLGVELGRPAVGAYFRDVEQVLMALLAADVDFELAAENPVTHFMTDKKVGKLREDVLNERVTSAIIEGKCKLENLAPLLRALQKVAGEIDTVFTAEVITKVPPTGEVPIRPILDELGIWYSLVSKNNMGLGLPAFKFYD